MSVFRHGSLNHSFSLVWNEESQSWVPAPEGSRMRGKRGATVLAAALTVLLGTAQAGAQLPTGGQVTAGAATIQQAGSTLNIQQATRNAAIDWQQFSIGAGGTVRFDQPSSAAVMLNRVVGQDPTQILGNLQANGQIFIVNPSGILFGQGAQVSTAGLLASTRDISSADFATGQFRFSGNGTGKVVNQGTLSVGQGGYVALIGAQVVNAGTIQAPGGDVRLAAADAVSVRIDGAGLAGFTVERGTIDGLVANHGLIQANGGRVGLTADAADALAKAVVNHDGIIEAQAVASHNGTVELRADSQVGQLDVSGRVDVSSASGVGGTVTATARAVNLMGTAAIDASGATGGGKVLIGGGWQGKDAGIANASTVTMAPGARIDVSARDNGNGGTAVLWSQDGTAFAGEILARGGAHGGSGGQVETSSHDVLQAIGSVDASAAAGAGGQWLLDPRNVIIAASGASGTGFAGSTSYGGTATFNPGADSVILASTIVNSLNAGVNVTITTGSTGTSAGNITVAAPIVSNGVYGQPNTLSLLAANDININARIADTSSAYFNKLNVVLTPGSAGNVNFSATGSITTLGGNVYIGTVSGTGYAEAVSRAGQNFTMAAGSFIDSAGGMIDAKVNGAITLSANSLRNSGGTPYYNSNTGLAQAAGSTISLTGASITSSNTDAATPDIQARSNVTLSADSVGDSLNPIKVSGYDNNGGYQLSVNNTVGNSYVNEIGLQAFTHISVNIGSQLNSTQDIRLLDDFGGDGHSGTGHLLLNTDGAGVLNLATGDIATGALTNARASNVQISAGNITFADGSVNTGAGSFRAAADTLTAATGSANNNVAEILAPDVQLVGREIGTQSHPLELSSGATSSGGQLSIYNTGGSTFAKVVDDNFTSVYLNHEKTTGTHSVLFAGGDHLDYATNGSDIVLPGISGGASDGSTFFATSGLDATRRNRNVSITANSGGIVFDDNAVNLGYGSFSATIARQNGTGLIAALNNYDANAQAAQITAGNVSFNVLNDPTPGVSTIGAGGKQIQIAQGAGAAYNSLSVSTQQGSVAIQELTQNHFKNISLNLGSASAAQSVAIGLAGADDINFSDSGSLVSIDAAKVNVASGNRGFSLQAGMRSIQIDGQSQSTGDYNIYAGNLLKLNSDIVTDGGNITLTGYNGIDLMRSVRIDSNADRVGNGGTVTLNTSASAAATLSGTSAGQTLTVDTSSTNAQGGTINAQLDVNARAGGFLGGMTLNAAGSSYAQDGGIYLGNSSSTGAAASILLQGNFSATGRTQLNSYFGFNLDTEQGSTAAGGNITFAGADLTGTGYYGTTTFNTSTALAGANGGNVMLATQNQSGNGLNLAGVLVDARGAVGGTAGDISLNRISTTSLYGGAGTQTYLGRTITLNGDLSSTGKNIAMSGDVRLARSVTIDSNSAGFGASGAVTIAGPLSANAAGAALSIDTSSPDSSSGGVQLTAGTGNAGGYNLASLNVNTSRGASGLAGTIILGAAVATEGAQTYAGGAVSTTGGLSTNGGNIDLRGASAVNLTGAAGSAYTVTTDRSGGSNAAGALLLGANSINGNYALTIDTTADGGGAAANLALNGVGATTAFSSIKVAAGGVTLGGTTRASGNVTVEAHGANADLTIASSGAVSTTGASDIVLAAGRNFSNNRGATGIAPGAGGRYFVYSSDPSATLEGMSGYGKHYNQGYTAGATPAYAGSGNWFFYSIAPVITVSSNAGSIVYGSADPSLALGAGNYSGFIDGDTLSALSGFQSLSLAGPGPLSGAGYRQVGSYTYTLNGTLTDSLGYQYAVFSQFLAVTPRDLAIDGIAASNRVYDGTTNATLTGTATVTALAGDTVGAGSAGATGSFADANAGVGKAVSVSGFVIAGADSANYTVVQPTGVSATITPKALGISGSSVATKTYDGTIAANVDAGTLTGLVGSESLGLVATGIYADKNAGTGKSVGVVYALGNGGAGGLASNYTLANETLTGAIAQKAITVAADGVGKVYDGGTAASANLGSSGVVAGDMVSFNGAASFADKNAGVGKAINVTGIGANGTDAANYLLNNSTASTTANIAQKAITVAASGAGKVYDGNADATVVLGSTGVVSGDTVSFGGLASYADKNAGVGKLVSVSGIGASGTDAGNYVLDNSTAYTTADIAQKAITVAASGVNKVYDGSMSASVNLGSSGVVTGDVVSFNGAAGFVDKNAGVGKTVDVVSIGASGTDAGNYVLNNSTASTTADIAQKAITVAASGVGKVYDGSTSAGANLGSIGVVEGDAVSFNGAASFVDKNAGVGKVVNVSGIGASGTDAGNYVLNNSTASTAADIAQKAITVAASGVGKVYDGSTSATANLGSSGVVTGDVVSFNGVAGFVDKNAGVGKVVNVTGIGASGTDAGNYALNNSTASTAADIAQKAITVAASGVAKVYDGSTSASANLGSSGVVTGDVVSFNGVAGFVDKNAGVGKVVNVTGIGASGTDAGNYVLNNSMASTTADIAQKAITVAAGGVGKVYDGSTSASVNLGSGGVVSGDTVSFGGSASYADKNAGVGKLVSVSGIGASGTDAANYVLNNSTASTTADIAQKAITVTASGVGKVYDGSTSASANLGSSGVVNGDAVFFGGSASYTDKNAGVGKLVSVSGIGVSGIDAGNYVLNNSTTSTTSTTADIAQKAITVAASGVNKVYDGSTSAGANLGSTGVVEGDTVSFAGSAALSDKNVGIGKAVSVTGIAASGADAGNYAINTTASTTADVSAKAITVAASGIDKVYDGGTSASVNLGSGGVVAGDVVSFNGAAGFVDKNAGAGKTVNVTEIGASGTDAGNYVLNNSTASTTASVAQKAITVAASGVGKVYDGSTAASANLGSSGVVAGDVVAFNGTAGFIDKNAAAGKMINVSGIGASGTDAGNYALNNSTASTTADIAQKAITVAASGVNKVYDGSTAVAVQLGSTGVVAGDVVSFSGTGNLADRNAGTGKAVSVTGIGASGADAGNYQVNGTASTTADVAQRALSVALGGTVAKTRDGNLDALLNPANYLLQGLVAGEGVTITRTAGSFADMAVGKGKTVTTTLGVGDFRGDGQTLLSNYQIDGGKLSAAIGEIKDDLSASAGYTAALHASTSWHIPGADLGERIRDEAQDGTPQPQGTARRHEATVVSTNTPENLALRRAFSIGDGGIRLPAGVVGSDKDASQ